MSSPILSFFKKKNKPAFVISFFITMLLQINIFAQNILINEFMASNATTLTDEFGSFDDWVELYNPTATPVNIGGFYITDNLTNPTLWQIPASNPTVTTVPANGYLLLWFDKQTDQGALHINAKLGSSGEAIGLFASDGVTLIDSRTFGVQYGDVSEGRVPNGGADWDYYSEPTPNAANTTDPGLLKAASPTASIGSGFYNGVQTVTLSTTTIGGTIYYTNDGSVPTQFATEYTSPVTITENTPLRAVTFANGYDPSNPATFNYLINVNHTFPVITVTAGNDLIFGANGIYPNYTQDIEIPAHVELIENDGTIGFSQIAEIEIHGSASATLPQKSLALKAKKSLGGKKFDYPIFDDLGFDAYRSLVIRNSGQDHNLTMFRDALVSSLVRDVSDVQGIISKPKLHTQGYRPGVVYINAEYWGIHNIRERMDKRYLKVHFGLDDTEVDFLENIDEVKEGDVVEWYNLVDFLNVTDFSNDANFDVLKTKLDVDHYLDYMVFNLYIDNWDWPGNNNKRWRERVADAKWQFMTWDLDFSFGLYSPQGWNSGAWFNNSLSRLFVEYGNAWPNPSWSTLIFRKMITNQKWRTDFINRMADQMNVLYDADRINGRIDEFKTIYAPEMPAHIDRWTTGTLNWDSNINVLKTFANNRAGSVRQHFVSTFQDINGTAEVTLNANPSNGGSVKFSTLTLGENQFPWNGIYFRGVDIPVEAVANAGYVFTGWSVGSMGNNPLSQINISGNTWITANFAPIGNPSPQTINFANISDKLTTDAPFQISASASSGLPVSFSISGVATINNNTITLNGSAGSVTVTASQNGNATYQPATNITRTFNVTTPLQGNNPTVILSSPSSTVVGNFTVNIQFSESVNDLTLAEVQVTNGTKSNAAGGGANYSFTVTPSSYGMIYISIPAGSAFDGNGNPNSASNILEVNYPNPNTGGGNPTVILSTASSTVIGNFTVNIEFDESVTDLTLAEIQVTNGTKSNATGGGANYNFTITPTDFGMVQVSVPAGSAFDVDGNPNLASNILEVNYPDPNTGGGCNTFTNLALQKPATQSGTQQQGDASRATDGNTNGDFWSDNSVSLTNWQAQPWWEIDLGEISDIEEIKIWNRTDCCMESLDNYYVFISNTPFASTDLTETLNQAGVSNFLQNNIAQRPSIIAIHQTGRYVRLQLKNHGFLTLAEVEIMGCQNGNSNPTTNPPTTNTYCESSGLLQTGEWIETIAVNNLFNNSGKNGGYADFTYLSAALQAGGTYPVVLNPGYTSFTHQEYWRVWIDLNQDGDFDDVLELVFEGNNNGSISGNIFIPQNINNGSTRMRISMGWNNYVGSCVDFNFGEVEDYTVNLSGGSGATVPFVAHPSQVLSVEKGLQAKVFPNPVEDLLILDYTTSKMGSLKINLMNLHGTVVYKKKWDAMIGGDRLFIELDDLPAGVYILFLKQGSQQKAIRVVKVKL